MCRGGVAVDLSEDHKPEDPRETRCVARRTTYIMLTTSVTLGTSLCLSLSAPCFLWLPPSRHSSVPQSAAATLRIKAVDGSNDVHPFLSPSSPQASDCPSLLLTARRIKAAGGFVTREGRVNGNLNLSRAIGQPCFSLPYLCACMCSQF